MTKESGGDGPGWIRYAAQGMPMGMSNLPEPVRCRSCGGPLDVHRQVTTQVCDRPECQTALHTGRIDRARRGFDGRDERRDGPRPLAYRRATPVALEATRRAGAAHPAEAVAAVVPFNSMPLAPLPAARRAAFEAHLAAIVAEAFAGGWDEALAEPQRHFAARAADEPDDPPAVAACCAACQGYCCLLGKASHAFLEAHTIAYFRHRNPGATAEEVVDAYLAPIPEIATREGCVYQGARGCTLPREMRGDICNSYRCSGQERVLEEAAAKPGAPVALVALATWHWDPSELTEGEELHRVLTIDRGGNVAMHDDIPLPPLPDPEA